MAQAMYPENQPGAVSSDLPTTQPGAVPTPQTSSTPGLTASVVARPRPGLVTFAASMMFLLGAFQLLFAIEEFAGAVWVARNIEGTVGGPLWVWGIVDVVFAVAALYAGYDLLRGGRFGQLFGLIVASMSAIRWFFYIPAAPWAAVVAIVVDIFIIYGLTVHADYFSSARLPTG